MITEKTYPERIEEIKKLLKFYESPEIFEALAQEYERHANYTHAVEDDIEHSRKMAPQLRRLAMTEDREFYKILEVQEKERIDRMMAL